MTQINVHKILFDLIEKSGKHKNKLESFANTNLAYWLIHKLKNIAEIDQINELLAGGEGLSGKKFNEYVYESLDIRVNELAIDNLPLVDGKIEGRNYVAVSNHALGAVDGVLLMHAMSKYAQPTMMVGQVLSYIKEFGDYFITVRGFSQGNLAKTLKKIEKLAHTDRLIMGFPSGSVSKKNFLTGKTMDSVWKKGILKAVEEERNVIPIYFEGKLPSWYYWKMLPMDVLSLLPGLNKIIPEIKAAYQPRATFQSKGKEFDIVYGKPIPYEYFTHSYNSKQKHSLMQLLKDHVYHLKVDPYAEFVDPKVKLEK